MSLQLEIKKNLENRKKELEKLAASVEKYIVKGEPGHLEIKKDNGGYRYYIKSTSNKKNGLENSALDNNGKTRTYLNKNQMEIARNVAMRDYAKKLYKYSFDELNAINKLLCVYQNPTIEDYYETMHPGRQQLISPFISSEESLSPRHG